MKGRYAMSKDAGAVSAHVQSRSLPAKECAQNRSRATAIRDDDVLGAPVAPEENMIYIGEPGRMRASRSGHAPIRNEQCGAKGHVNRSAPFRWQIHVQHRISSPGVEHTTHGHYMIDRLRHGNRYKIACPDAPVPQRHRDGARLLRKGATGHRPCRVGSWPRFIWRHVSLRM